MERSEEKDGSAVILLPSVIRAPEMRHRREGRLYHVRTLKEKRNEQTKTKDMRRCKEEKTREDNRRAARRRTAPQSYFYQV